ncbi:MAG: amidase [Solirubrobacterales bacterium]
MSNVATDAFQNALALLRRRRGASADIGPAFDLTLPTAATHSHLAGVKTTPAEIDGSIGSTHKLLESGDLTSVELVARSLRAIEQQNDQLYAFVEILEVEALERAKKADSELSGGRSRGPLHGIPVSVKDLYAVAGATTRAGSMAFERRDHHDAHAVKRLREAGAVIIGKTSTHEFAMGVTAPQSRNPHDPTRIAGGSSSGAAIAVATGMGMAALGTDTRGSIRIPAALTGVVGLKPTFGAVPLEGVVPLSWTMDHVGVMAASSADAAATLDALTGGSIYGASARSISGMRVGLPRTAWRDVESAVGDSIETVLDSLAATGARIVEVERPDESDFDRANLTSMVVSRSEAAAFHRDLGLDQQLYTSDVRTQLETATEATAGDYIDAQRLRAQLQREVISVFEDVDILLMPTVPIVAPPVETADQTPLVLTRNVALWSFLGFPAMSVPCVPSPAGMPIGLQIVAAPHAEAALVAVGRAVERGVNAR